ncbi:MAG: IclR family transcriptional regulator [Phycisphaerales bacterium]|jgi:DNA-binding IclR family transcriptional regulator|nr:IclR family transcriptional regulator [Phycisphaerales bacterium]MBT7171033.1 IclR family transcriptional regulator [Phycisphaerales bacterium]
MAKRDPRGDSRYHVPNLMRGMKIMEYLSSRPEGVNMIDIAKALEMPNNSVFRIAMTLLELGYLDRDEKSKKFTLTRKLLALGYAAVSERSLLEEALGPMRALRDEVRETVLLATLLETDAIVLEQVSGTHPFHFSIDAGRRGSLHCSAHGKVFLAWVPDKEREELLSAIEMTYYNENTITSVEAMRKEIEVIRAQGYAVDHAEELAGVHCLSAPIFNQKGYPVAAITVTGPADRMPAGDLERIGQLVRQRADEVSAKLGYGAMIGREG